MNAERCKFALLGLVLFFATGCNAPAKPITLEVAGIEPGLHYSDLAFVLQKAVTKDGLLIPAALKEHSDRLDRQLRLLAVTGPTVTTELFGSEEDRIAYWYNARAAWAMKLVLLSECPKKLHHRRLRDRRFPLDGRTMSLGRIDEILKTYDDWRVLVASPGVTLRRCRLPTEPFSSQDVPARIARRLNTFVDDGRRVVIDIKRRRVVLPPVLWQYRERLIRAYQETYNTRGANLITALLPYVEGSAHRRLQDAIGYRCVAAGPSLLLALLEE